MRLSIMPTASATHAALCAARTLAPWQHTAHYRGEAIDLRLFFHSGWSS